MAYHLDNDDEGTIELKMDELRKKFLYDSNDFSLNPWDDSDYFKKSDDEDTDVKRDDPDIFT